jgi:hypothetical protein
VAHKRIKITIETERILKIRRSVCTRLGCQKCGCEVDVVDLSQAEVLTGIAQSTLHTGLEVDKWHSVEGPDGTLFVCLRSLLKSQ